MHVPRLEIFLRWLDEEQRFVASILPLVICVHEHINHARLSCMMLFVAFVLFNLHFSHSVAAHGLALAVNHVVTHHGSRDTGELRQTGRGW